MNIIRKIFTFSEQNSLNFDNTKEKESTTVVAAKV